MRQAGALLVFTVAVAPLRADCPVYATASITLSGYTLSTDGAVWVEDNNYILACRGSSH
jgi:hypothetical protein